MGHVDDVGGGVPCPGGAVVEWDGVVGVSGWGLVW